jgi:hypothetical protein
MDELVSEAKGLTFEFYREHAVVQLDNGRRAMIQGETFGIGLERTLDNDPFGRAPGQLFVEIEGEPVRVRRLVFHTHPKPTGPSDDDLLVLEILGQRQSMLYELFGPWEGTEIRPKKA